MTKYIRTFLVLILGMGLTALFIVVLPAQGRLLVSPEAAISVNTLDDEDNTDGDCSLREAIHAANDNIQVDGCLAGDGMITDTITFSESGTITLAEQLTVTAGGPLVIDGAGAITISGNDSVRIFYVQSGADLTLESITLMNGYMSDDSGGGIYNDGMLTISNSTLSNNSALGLANSRGGGIANDGRLNIVNSALFGNSANYGGSIYNWSTLTISDSTLSDNNATDSGGGIYNEYGSLTLTNSVLSGNSIIYSGGGGIYNLGALTISNSTLSSNSTGFGGNGGGIDNSGTLTIINTTLSGNSGGFYGGGIYTGMDSTLKITNSTLSGNSAGDGGGGIYNVYGSLTLTNSTLSDNSAGMRGGGIDNNYGEASLSNSIIANSVSGGNCAGDPITDTGYNIEDTDTCGFLPANGSMPNTDPLLRSLHDNGGPSWTHALLPGSPALDAADPTACPPTDQRGVPRPLDGDDNGVAICDIGSYELGMFLDPAFLSASAVPGTTLVYTIDLSNFTNLTDTYTLALGQHAWETVLSTQTIAALPSGESQAFTVSVSIPVTATQYMTDTVIVSAASTTSPTIYFETAQITTQVVIPNIYLPLVTRPMKGIFGWVTNNGVPVSGIYLELRFFNGTSWSTMASTNTDINGKYVFDDVPALLPGQVYYVLYKNSGDPNRLWMWGTRDLTRYSQDDSVIIGIFDIANIQLVAPVANDEVGLPYTFRWTPRLASPSDSYEFNLFDPYDEEPYFWTDPPLGYVDNYPLNKLPPGFESGEWYVWDMWVYSPDGGFGISYEARWVSFADTALSSIEAWQTNEPKSAPHLDYQRERSDR